MWPHLPAACARPPACPRLPQVTKMPLPAVPGMAYRRPLLLRSLGAPPFPDPWVLLMCGTRVHTRSEVGPWVHSLMSRVRRGRDRGTRPLATGCSVVPEGADRQERGLGTSGSGPPTPPRLQGLRTARLLPSTLPLSAHGPGPVDVGPVHLSTGPGQGQTPPFAHGFPPHELGQWCPGSKGWKFKSAHHVGSLPLVWKMGRQETGKRSRRASSSR